MPTADRRPPIATSDDGWPRSEIQKILDTYEAPRYVAAQIYTALTRQCIGSFSEITTLPKDLRALLAETDRAVFPLVLASERSFGSEKLVLELSDGHQVETVLIHNSVGQVTACVSTQVGCPLSCAFCATGKLGFKRNLSAWEIASQVFAAARAARTSGKRVTNVVVMGMGEPFLNLEAVVSALRLLNDAGGFNLAARKISISTAGVIHGIEAMTSLPEQFNLAISLHSPFDDQRRELMPISRGYTISKLMSTARRYVEASGRMLFLEYLLLRDVNVTDRHLRALVKLADHPLFHINLIPYNSTNGELKALSRKQSMLVLDKLQSMGARVTLRRSMGGHISAGCGQLGLGMSNGANG